MIEKLETFPDNVLAFVCTGRVTKADYEMILVPAVLDALKAHGKLRLYYEIAPDFTGIDHAAMWEDIKVGMEHFNRWERIAVVTDVEWIKHTIRAFSFLMPASVKIFSITDAAQARSWATANN